MNEKEKETPAYFILAGVNGAGKSTLHDQIIDKEMLFINPDVIARQISPDNVNDPAVSLQSGKLAIKQLEQAIKDKKPFVFETTLTSNHAIKSLKMAKEAGFETNLHYVGVDSIATSIERVASRVKAGGHDIPIEALERRYSKSLDNLPKAMLLSDKISLFDNSGTERVTSLIIENDKYIKRGQIPDWGKIPLRKYEEIKMNSWKLKDPEKLSEFKEKILGAKTDKEITDTVREIKKQQGLKR